MANMIKPIVVLLIAAAAAFPAGDPAGFHVWKASQIDVIGKKLRRSSTLTRWGAKSLVAVGNRSFFRGRIAKAPDRWNWQAKVADIPE